MLKLNPLDRLIGLFAPEAAVRRGAFRRILAEYEGGKPGRLRKSMREDRSPNHLVGASAAKLRNYARHQERNFDIARGALNVLVRNVVGPDGIGIEPMPKRLDGKTHDGFATELMRLFRNWSLLPEVTWRYDWAGVQRILARAWFRDGESFAQIVEGFSPRLDHGTRVPLSLELLEADLVPLDYEDPARGIRQGVEMNEWKRPRAYWVYKDHPGDAFVLAFPDLKRVDSERVIHLALRDRLHQIRGVSIFASVINRFEDLKDYEESERVAARIAAALTAVIKRDPESVGPPSGEESEAGRPLMKIEAGTVFDGAAPGDEITVVDTKRPNVNLETFRMGQLRAAAAGISTSFSSVAKNYDGTYSAQRQELVEQWAEYRCLSREFISQCIQPIWERFVGLAILSGAVRLPADLDVSTMAEAEFVPPPMPWIDPMKEIQADRLRVRTGQESLTQQIRARGRVPWETFLQIEDERAYLNARGIVTEADPAADRGTSAAPAEDPPEDPETPPDSALTRQRKTRARNARSRTA